VRLRDREREALADRVVHELVAGGAGVGVDVARGDLDRRLREGKRLHVREMRREDDARPALHQIGQDADRERRALDGIGAGPGFVEQHEAARRRLARDRREVRRVRGERREVAFDRLRVADVGQDGREAGQSRALRGMHEAAGLREERRQPQGLERHGLAARVGARDGEPALAVPEHDVDRHDPPLGELQERVADRAQQHVARAEPSAASHDGRWRRPRSRRGRRRARARFERRQRRRSRTRSVSS
jgi:hypothetical protein